MGTMLADSFSLVRKDLLWPDKFPHQDLGRGWGRNGVREQAGSVYAWPGAGAAGWLYSGRQPQSSEEV